MSGHEQSTAGHAPSGKEQRKKIIQVFLLLAVITAIEFIIAFVMGRSGMRNALFILLTLVKAFYIVAEFMHLRHEVKSFVYTILFPILFLLWLILALLIEGNFTYYGWFGDAHIIPVP